MSTPKKIELEDDSGFDGSNGDDQSGTDAYGDGQQKEEEPTIAKAETKVVGCFRLAVFAILAVSMALVGYFVYTYISGSEQAQFEDDFHGDANKVFESIGKSLDVTIGAVDAFVVSLISYSHLTDSSWPFVTMPGTSKQLYCFRLIIVSSRA